ncbi:hypothetical protein FRY77_06260 [Halomonas sp. MG34]|nr:hypothetical protein [Halomonas sp. MG34]
MLIWRKMHSVIAKHLIIMILVVLVTLSGAGFSSAVKGSCLVDAPVSATISTDSHCHSPSLLEQAADHADASCSPFAPASANAISMTILTPSPQWLMKVPYPQSHPERLEKPPRLSLHF